MFITEEINMIISSDPIRGASNISADGSSFEIDLDDGGISIPKTAEGVHLQVDEATAWWTIPNIITGVNDTLYITGPDTLDVYQNFEINIPQGLYDLSGLNQAILRELEIAGAKIDPLPLITLLPDEPTQKVEIRLEYASTVVDFLPNDTFRDIIGFNAALVGPFLGAQTTLGDNVAKFNTIDSLLLHSDLTTRGLRLNNQYDQTIAQILIDVSPGSQIVSRPFNPARINVEELKGQQRKKIRFWLTDQNNNQVNTTGEYFTARLVIKYKRPFVITKSNL